MASYGLRVWAADGVTLTFDSETAGFGCLADVISVTSNANITKTYPDFPGKTCTVVQMCDYWDQNTSVDYALGYPRVTVPAGYTGQALTYGVFMT